MYKKKKKILFAFHSTSETRKKKNYEQKTENRDDIRQFGIVIEMMEIRASKDKAKI